MSIYPFLSESNADSAPRAKGSNGIGQFLSDSLLHPHPMNPWKCWTTRNSTECIIARFGMGRLIRCDGIRYELRGGSPWDLSAAREWAAHFLHEAFIDEPAELRIDPPVSSSQDNVQSRCPARKCEPDPVGRRW